MDQGGRGRTLTGEGMVAETRSVLSEDRLEVDVPTPDNGHITVQVRERRADVVARLLAMGVSARTLTTLLPEWADLIDAVAAEHIDAP